MLSLRPDLLPVTALILCTWTPAAGQSVISARSGVVHFFEGSVYIGDHRLERQFGTFPDISEGAELRTAGGRAEILLTPGVILRIGENSAIRMLSSELADTRVELRNGSGILESTEARPENSVTMIYKTWQVRFQGQGAYRIDSEPPQLRVYRGEADVADDRGTTVAVKAGQTLPFAEVLVPNQSAAESPDLLSDWAMDRSQAISADNAIAAQITDDPNAINGSGPQVGGFTYFPQLGIPVLGRSLFSPYGLSSWNAYSIYMPGYSYYSFYPGWAGGVGGYVPVPQIGIRPPRPATGSPPHRGTAPAPHAPPPVHTPAPHIGTAPGHHR